MISRKRCREIADEWVIKQATAAWQRHMTLIRKEYANKHSSQRTDLGERIGESILGLLSGDYDPPTPKIPGWFDRLFRSDWTPGAPTKWRVE